MTDPEHDSPAADVPAPARTRRRHPAHETRARRRRAAVWVLSLMLGAMLVNAVVGESGYLSTVEAAREEATLRAAVAQLRLENQRLQEQGRRLTSDPAAVEEAARQDLGMIRPGETLIVVKDAVPSTPGGTTK
jgi:cell division protein FtsB